MFKYFHYIILSFVFLTNQPIHAQTWELKWSDEFISAGLPDNTKWGYDVGGSGWGNNELQYYTDSRLENARVENGNLIIEARKEAYGGKNYTSARLVSRNKGDWKYGRIEVKAKLPGGRGTWPAIWMLPTDWVYGAWPASGEIDIMEYVGYDPGIVHGTVHTEAYNHSIGTQVGASYSVPNAETAFHVYAIEWDESKIDFFVDGNKYFTFNNQGTWQKWPFDQRFHLILNIAIGGNWGGVQGVDDNIFPVKMEIDYVRVYQAVGELKISGNEYAEPNSNAGTYSTANIVGASYNWNVPDDASIVSGHNTSSINVNWGNTEGNVSCQISYDGNTHEIYLPVMLVTIPSGDLFIFDEFNNENLNNISYIPGINTFEFNKSNDELKVTYNVLDASQIPNFILSLDRPVKLNDLQVMQVKFKTYNLSNSVIARIDLVDVNGVRTNGNTVFRLEPIYSDGEFHLYEFDFSGRWISNSPNYGVTVDNSKIQKAIIYLNYGFFGKNNKTDSIWIDYIHMIKEKTLSVRPIEKKKLVNIYPNPARNNLTIHSSDNFNKIFIYANSGQFIKYLDVEYSNTTTIDISSLDKGTYIIVLKDRSGKIKNSLKVHKIE